jgi:hypothetical protein
VKVEKEPSLRPAPTPPPPGPEQEVDLRRQGRALLAGWWLLLLGLVLGALIGYAVSAAGGRDVHRAEATIYLGQPISAGGGTIVPSVGTNPPAVREIARSDEVVQEVAAAVDIPADRLKSAISTSQLVSGTGQLARESQIFEISVQGGFPRASVAQAANLLAEQVVERLSIYAESKITAYEERLDALERDLESAEARIERLQDAAAAPGLSDADRLVLVSLIGFAENRRSDVVLERTETQLFVAQAREVERGRVLTEARAVQVTPRSDRTSLVVGALVGLLAGAVAALAWEPIRRRLRST